MGEIAVGPADTRHLRIRPEKSSLYIPKEGILTRIPMLFFPMISQGAPS